MADVKHLTNTELEAGLDEIRQSPKDDGVLRLIVRRPQTDQRDVLQEGLLTVEDGLTGDKWKTHGGRADLQLTIMNSRAIALVAQDPARWPLAGDQLFIDLDLSADNLPAGTRLEIGSAVLEVSTHPHNGCKKFMARFGNDALEFVNSPVGKHLHLRGVNARVTQPGVIRVGDVVKKRT